MFVVPVPTDVPVGVRGMSFRRRHLSWAGFPVGHLTDYARATGTLRVIFLWIYLAPALYFLRLAFPGLTLRTKAVRFFITLAALILLIAITEIAIPWYFIGLNPESNYTLHIHPTLMNHMARPVKELALQLLQQLPDDVTWDDVVYKLVTRMEIEKGLEDSSANRTTPVEDVLKEFGFKE